MGPKLTLQEQQTWYYWHLPKGGVLLRLFELQMFVMETEGGNLAWNFKDILNLVINYSRRLGRLAITTIVYFKRCFKKKIKKKTYM